MLIRLVLAVKSEQLQKKLEEQLNRPDVRIDCWGSTQNAWQKIARACGDVIVISESLIPQPTESGIAILNELPETPTTVILHESDSSEAHAHLVEAGADVVLSERLSARQLASAIETTLETRRQMMQLERFDRRGRIRPQIGDFITESETMRVFMDEVQQVIPGNSVLLICGETGSGKEHLARAIHAESPRSANPFVAVNAAALPDQLLESELFGHEQGAFTGAIRSRRGAFEMAHGGTLLLDEIGEMPLHLQSKLLRVLQDYEVRPVGSERPVWVDVRVMASTNSNLEQEVRNGKFRQDLFYRLSVVTLTVPPLRRRREDIPALAQHFVETLDRSTTHEVKGMADNVLEALCRYDWPGNVRELMNVIERAMLVCTGDVIQMKDLPMAFRAISDDPGREAAAFPPEVVDLWRDKTLAAVRDEVLTTLERKYLEMALRRTHGRVGEAARIAGIHPRGMHNKMKQLGLKKEAFKKR